MVLEESVSFLHYSNGHSGLKVEEKNILEYLEGNGYLSTPLMREQRLALSTVGNMSYRRSARYTDVDLDLASMSDNDPGFTKYVTSAM